MKKLIAISAMLFVALTYIAYSDNIPAPFGAAKKLALQKAPDPNGNHIVNYECEKSVFIIGYLPGHRLIGIGEARGVEIRVVQYNETTGEFSGYMNGYVFPMEEKDALKVAFGIFRELVSRNFI